MLPVKPKPPPGRTPGLMKKFNVEMRERVQEIYRSHDCSSPVEALAILAYEDGIKPDIRLKCHSEVAKYIHPQLRAIEVSGNDEAPIPLVLNSTDAAL